MKRSLFWIPSLIACVVMLGAVATADDVDVFVVGEGGTVFDLSELRDGETRVFGQGERQLTATREDGEVRLARDAFGDEEALSFTCNLKTDSCQVVTRDDDPRVAIRVERKLECVNGVGDCGNLADMEIVAVGGDGAAKKVIVKKLVDCKGKDCSEKEIEIVHAGPGGQDDLHWVSAAGEDSHMVFIDEAHGGRHVRRFHADQALLTCPEGDATLRVARDEADQTFLCPKHNVPMEKRAAASRHTVVIESDDE